MLDLESGSEIESEDESEIMDTEEIAMELNEELNKNNQKERKRRRIFWSLEIIFNNYDEAIDGVKNKWTKTKVEHTKQGDKEYYKCSINEKCKAKMHLFCLDNSQQVNLMRDQTEHDHSYQNTNKRLRREIKNRISELYKIGVTAPLNIIYTLRKDGCVNLPTQKQISNYIARNEKNLKGETQISYSELAEWCAKNTTIPDDEDKAFVLDYEVSSENKDDQYIRIMMSTKFLLNLASKNSKFGCTDATYKLIYQGHSVIIVGHVDKERQFHPTGVSISTNEKNEDYFFMLKSIQVNQLTN